MANDRLIDYYMKLNISKAIEYYGIIDNQLDIDKQLIQVVYQKSNLGNGQVPFFKCPDCNKSRRDMYLRDNHWSCYKCHDFTYYSQQRSRNTYWYWMLRAEQEARKIDPDFKMTSINDIWNYWLIFPEPKPKNMQQRKYDEIFFWYDMYVFRATMELHNKLAPARRFIAMTKKNAPIVEKQLQELIEQQKSN